jgi:hypothetical protein
MLYRQVDRMSNTLLAALSLLLLTANSYPDQKQFDDSINTYMKLRKQVSQGVPALKAKATPEEIEASKTSLAHAIRTARQDAKPGDIFTPEIRASILKSVRPEVRADASVKEATKQGNPTEETPAVAVPVKVNAPYPEKASASTVPPAVLQQLPRLPKQLDFRFVGRHLILRDAEAGIILDYIANALPPQ